MNENQPRRRAPASGPPKPARIWKNRYRYFLHLFDILIERGEARRRATRAHRCIFTPAERLANQLADEWLLVRERTTGFVVFLETGFDGDFAARNFEHIGLPRIADIYRRAHALLPPGRPRFGWDPRKELAPETLQGLEALSDEVRRADVEIANGMIAFLERLPSVGGAPREPAVPLCYYQTHEQPVDRAN